MSIDIFENRETIPVWFMRQAGRYHAHYQALRAKHGFMQLCKNPDLACEVTLGPISDFGFNAAILFSDLLFPLENLGMGLHYNDGPPKLAFHLKDKENFAKLKSVDQPENFYLFQKQACEKLRKQLPEETTLLGFVGAPFTLYTYAVEGAHAGSLVNSKKGLYDGRWDEFWKVLYPQVLTEMTLQVEGGAQCICVFDTAAGELAYEDYTQIVLPKLSILLEQFKQLHPGTKILYYSKHTHLRYVKAAAELPIDIMGVDWRHDLVEVFRALPSSMFIQGNLDPCWLHLSWENLEKKLELFKEISSKVDRKRWIFGLGHGVLPETPQENVRKTVAWVHENLKI